MREATLEAHLVRAVERAKGRAIKWVSPGLVGVPDRAVLLPGGRIVFVELKARGKAPRPLQRKRHDELRALGFPVYVIDSLAGIEAFAKEWFGTWHD